MKFFATIVSILLVCSCKNNGLKDDLKKSDAVTIQFYKNAIPDSVLKIVRTTSSDAIEKLSSFISSSETKELNCPQDGNIQFTKGDKTILIARFNALNNKCRVFTFDYKGKHFATKVSNEASDFLTSLWAGKNYY